MEGSYTSRSAAKFARQPFRLAPANVYGDYSANESQRMSFPVVTGRIWHHEAHPFGSRP
jgi:hypothetical protein